MGAHRHSLFSSFLFAVVLLSGCRPEGDRYEAEIRRTSYGIPHIKARDIGSLGFGEGYALAQDHLCSVADQVVKVRGERARYFGAGENDRYLSSDVGFKALEMVERARSDLARQPAEVHQWIDGYAAGYNHYLRQTGVDHLTGFCRGQDWVFEVTPVDLQAYFRSVVVVTSRFARLIAAAAPPGHGAASTAGLSLPDLKQASNGWALGRDRAESGRGLLIANPHYPWVGSNRFWEKHLTIPGQMDVYGVGLIGVPGVAIGFNKAVAWTHTVSAGKRFTLYKLDLVPGKPTHYLYDGVERSMRAKTVRVQVKRDTGSLETVERTVYFSHYGPILNLRGLEWTEKRAVSIRDANEENDEATGQWLAMDRARSMDEFQRVHAEWNAMPWVNTISTSAEGRAWYADGSSTPNLSREAIDLWLQRAEKDPLTRRAARRGFVLLDGSDSRFEWVDDFEARDPGVVAFKKKPQLERTDYVFNANDSYWLANSSALLTGYSPMHGREATARSLRTRMNETSLRDTRPGGPAGEDGKFSLQELEAEILSNRSFAAELLLQELVRRCSATGSVRVDGKDVDISRACAVLKGYSGRLDLESRGAVLFREWITRYKPSALSRPGDLFSLPFDPAAPVETPRGLAPPGPKGDLALQSLARAVGILERAGLPLDVPLGEVQRANRGGRKIPIHGGSGSWEGVENVVSHRPNGTTLEPELEHASIKGSRYLTEDGYPVNSGTSFIMALEYTDAGPRAQALLTYSQSGDPKSIHFYDQTELFSKKAWRPILFSESQITADLQNSITVSGPR
ncbi:MAG: acylase [Acidobacteriota bacterium]